MTFLLPDGWKGEVVDVSAMGMRLQSLVQLAPSLEIEGELILEDGRTIRVRADVIWSTAADHRNFIPAELGLEIREPSPEYLEAVASLFAE